MCLADSLQKLHTIDRECRYLERSAALLQWDQETYLPPLGVEERSAQLAYLEGLHHERLTGPETGETLAALGSDSANPSGDERLPGTERDFIRLMRRIYDKSVKLPPDFVRAEAAAGALSQAAWVSARRNNDFKAFLPHLEAMIDFARKKALYWGFEGNTAYDGLLDIYEPAMTAEKADALFGSLQEGLSSLLEKIRSRPGPDFSFPETAYDPETQARFSRELLDYLGFDRRRGRLDVSAHPFTTTLGAHDVRITTRYFPDNPLSGIFSVIHEAGHAFYELGLPPELQNSALAEGASMAIHESQSRFWENVIGRSRAFLKGIFPVLQRYFPDRLGGIDDERFYAAVNRVRPSLIRVDADEVSYALHIILRFQLEKQLISGECDPASLPGLWREYSLRYLGCASETDADGVLQDVHWSMGSFGYFPSYALGNLYALQIGKKLRQDVPDFEELISSGRFDEIRNWLGKTVYCWGRRLDPGDLLKKITGEELSVQPFLDYLEGKYSEIYGF
ncbi:MAG: carboxypeptidase M32 [Treponema sp.]|jgi:carboxypeptidase Taq|nr:carboxypeptidase M32 [Treponema sp.]